MSEKDELIANLTMEVNEMEVKLLSFGKITEAIHFQMKECDLTK